MAIRSVKVVEGGTDDKDTLVCDHCKPSCQSVDYQVQGSEISFDGSSMKKIKTHFPSFDLE